MTRSSTGKTVEERTVYWWERIAEQERSGRQPLAQHLVRERVVHDLAESEKHCHCCGKDLRLVAE